MSDPEGQLSEERLFAGGMVLRQPRRGHRAGTDAVLLAAAAAPEPGSLVIDVGSGVGTIGIALALRDPTLRVRLLEREPMLAALARDNVRLNGVAARVEVEEADLFDRQDGRAERAALVLSNPPFDRPGTVTPSPVALKMRAYEGDRGDHGAWLHRMIRLAAPRGRVMVIHRPPALPDLLRAATGRLGGLRVRLVLSRAEGDALRIIVGGTIGSRAPLSFAPPLVLHDEGSAFTATAQALHRGERVLPLWDVQTRKSRPSRPASPITPSVQHTRTRCGP